MPLWQPTSQLDSQYWVNCRAEVSFPLSHQSAWHHRASTCWHWKYSIHFCLQCYSQQLGSIFAFFFHHLFPTTRPVFCHTQAFEVQMLPGYTKWRDLHTLLPYLSTSELSTSPSRNFIILHCTTSEQKVFPSVSEHPQMGASCVPMNHLLVFSVFASSTPLCFGSCLLTSHACKATWRSIIGTSMALFYAPGNVAFRNCLLLMLIKLVIRGLPQLC